MRRFIIAALSVLLLSAGAAHAQMISLTGAGGKNNAGGGGTPSVTVDVIGTQAFQSNSNNFNKTPINVGASATALACMVGRAHASNDVGAGLALTWNGVAMTARQTNFPGGATSGVALFGLRNPTPGTQTLNVSATNAATDNFVNCVSFLNVTTASDAAAFPNPTGATTSASVNVTSAAGHIAVGVAMTGGPVGTIIPVIVASDAASGAIFNFIADAVTSVSGTTAVGSSATMTVISGMDVSN